MKRQPRFDIQDIQIDNQDIYILQEMLELSKAYTKALEDEKTMTTEQKALKNVGKQVKIICDIMYNNICHFVVDLKVIENLYL